MEKTFQLDQRETTLLAQLDNERTQALAAVGALSLDMETARKNLDAAAERQRGFIRQAVTSRGIERYDNARAANGQLFVSLPDLPPLEIAEPVNGPAAAINPTAKHPKQPAKE
jgi:hypothetical protein